MHEISICVALLEKVKQIAAKYDAGAVSRIVIRLGPLSGVEPELLRNAYPLAAAGTLAAEAKLVIDKADIVVVCSQCHSESPADANRLICAECGDHRTRVVSGDEMLLQRVELKDIRKSEQSGRKPKTTPGVH